MILPGLKWRKWKEVHDRSMKIEIESVALLNRDSPAPMDPDASLSNFFDSVDAWLDDTGAVIGLSRSEVEQAAVAGQIEWRENFQQRQFETRIHGHIFRMNIRHPEAPFSR